MSKNEELEKNIKFVIQAIRFAGILIFVFGIILIFDFGGIAEKMGIIETSNQKIFGMVLSIMGIIEFILTPRILESVLTKNKK